MDRVIDNRAFHTKVIDPRSHNVVQIKTQRTRGFICSYSQARCLLRILKPFPKKKDLKNPMYLESSSSHFHTLKVQFGQFLTDCCPIEGHLFSWFLGEN